MSGEFVCSRYIENLFPCGLYAGGGICRYEIAMGIDGVKTVQKSGGRKNVGKGVADCAI